MAIAGLGVMFANPSGKRPEESREVVVEPVATNLRIPWSITFISSDEALFTERGGLVKRLDLSTGRVEEWSRVEVAAVGEGGLLGIENNRARIYIYYTYRDSSGKLWNRVVRYRDEGGLADPEILVDGIPGAAIHDGGRIRFGPDGMLYITTGDARVMELSQRLDSLAGKILRIAPDGSVPSDNPFKGSPIYSYGHRNPQGIDWHPETRLLYSTEHGPSGEKGWFAHDEVNLVMAGKNYGWPEVIGEAGRSEFVDPILHSGMETWAPAGASFYSGRLIPEWRNVFFFAALRGAALHMVRIGDEPDVVVSHEKLYEGEFGRLRDVVEGPDGALYVLTSNRDGRGVPREGDDKILRIAARS